VEIYEENSRLKELKRLKRLKELKEFRRLRMFIGLSLVEDVEEIVLKCIFLFNFSNYALLYSC